MGFFGFVIMLDVLDSLLRKSPASTHLHFLGICGIAMGQMAIEMKRLGFHISGSDLQCDPPISLLLAAAGINIKPSEPATHMGQEYDALVVGRIASAEDPIVRETATRGGLVIALPDLVIHFTRDSQRVVVAGTKGKTTTTAMLSWITDRAGLRPDFLIGGIPGCFSSGIRFNSSPLAILEGDEYASSPTDLTPKFVHYRPSAVVLTNVHPDHVELYPDFPSYRALFEDLMARLPMDGFAIVCGDKNAGTQSAIAAAPFPVTTVGWEATCNWRITEYEPFTDTVSFRFLDTSFSLPCLGKANVLDAALAIAAARKLGVESAISAAALRDFQPVEERLQLVGTPGDVRLFIDSNVHPASLQLAVESLRENSPTLRLLCVVQPQTPGTGDGYVQNALPLALARASHVLLAPPANQIEEADPPFSHERLLSDLHDRGIEAVYRDSRKSIIAWVAENIRPGDTILLAVHAPSRALLVQEISKALSP